MIFSPFEESSAWLVIVLITQKLDVKKLMNEGAKGILNDTN